MSFLSGLYVFRFCLVLSVPNLYPPALVLTAWMPTPRRSFAMPRLPTSAAAPVTSRASARGAGFEDGRGGRARRSLIPGTGLAAGVLLLSIGARAQPASAPKDNTPTVAPASTAPVDCAVHPDPYRNYSCLDAYLGTNVAERFYKYYGLELGQPGPPSDPNAPPGRRADWDPAPETTPPMPFTEWPYGGATLLGANRPDSVDSPLMVAIANTGVGKLMADAHIQVYGWLNAGYNISSNSQKPGGNAPIGYAYTPNSPELEQAVIYIERTPDTVQSDHIDWGFRLSGLYGVDYRYTTSYGFASAQLLKHNNNNGYDFPMLYGEIFVPQVVQGLVIRFGRYVSLPDIEAQLAPNNYMYTHSLTYNYDNFTNTGIQTTFALTRNLFLQLGITDGTETPIWHAGQRVPNLVPYNPLYPTSSFPRDPGNQPSYTACLRYSFNKGNDNVEPCFNAINRGNWGYNNLNWEGATYYHKFNDHWHLALESYYEFQDGVPNANNPQAVAIYGAGGTPFSPQYIHTNGPNLAQCKDPNALRCRASAIGVLGYLNYSPEPLDNISLRAEMYDDQQGQRTGSKAHYYELTLGLQHWFSPQIEVRPEFGYWFANRAVFDGNPSHGIPPSRRDTVLPAVDAIIHF